MAPAYEQGRTLKISILGVTMIDGRRTALMIPAGATVGIISAVKNSTAVVWEGKELTLFTDDLLQRSLPRRSNSGKR